MLYLLYPDPDVRLAPDWDILSLLARISYPRNVVLECVTSKLRRLVVAKLAYHWEAFSVLLETLSIGRSAEVSFRSTDPALGPPDLK